MALIKNASVWFAKLDPKRPNAAFNKKNPSWEVQLRTSDPEQKKQWEAVGLKPKLLVYKEGHENEGEAILTEDGKKVWRVNLRKKSIKEDGEKASPVKVVNGGLAEIDPNSIGNGSIAHVRVFQYEYEKEDKTKGIASVLMALQVIKHIVYTHKPRDDEFEMTETETVAAPDPVEGETSTKVSSDGGKPNANNSDDEEFVNDKPATKASALKVSNEAF